jgi:glyoxylase-like metal-dependent hydrolase (beta-lactamase superfamily II)
MEQKMIFEQVSVGKMANYSYIVAEKSGGEGFIVDPAFEVDKLMEVVKKHSLNITRIVLTHHHFDHINAAAGIKARTGAKIACHPETEKLVKGEFPVDELLEEGSKFMIHENISVTVIHTPGHAPGGICLQVSDTHLITGDTLFIGNCGRFDLPGGDPETLFNSLQKLKELPGSLIVCPGHNYGPYPTRSLKEEMEKNPTLLATLKEFVGN